MSHFARENKKVCETDLACSSQTGRFKQKNWARKSYDTVPLKRVRVCHMLLPTKINFTSVIPGLIILLGKKAKFCRKDAFFPTKCIMYTYREEDPEAKKPKGLCRIESRVFVKFSNMCINKNRWNYLKELCSEEIST